MQGIGIETAGKDLAGRGNDGIIGPRQSGDGIEEDDDVTLVLDKTLGFFDDHLRHLHVPCRRFVKSGGDHFAVNRTLHIGHFFRTLIDEQNDKIDLGMIGGDRVGDILQEHGLAGPRRRDDETALALTDRRGNIHHPHRQIVRRTFQIEALLRVQGGEVVKEGLFAGHGRIFEVDLGDLEEGKVAFPLLRRTNLSGDGVTGAQVKTTNLRRRDINIVRAGEVIRIGSTKKAEAVREDFKNPFAENCTILFGGSIEDTEDQILLAHPRGTLDLEFTANGDEVDDLLFFQFFQVHEFSLSMTAKTARQRDKARGKRSGLGEIELAKSNKTVTEFIEG